MRIFKIKLFHQWAKGEGVTDKMLKNAVDEIARGLVDGDLGAGLLKKRIARPGRGKSAGYRTLVGYHEKNRSIFFFGYSKSETENIEKDLLSELKKASKFYLSMADAKIEILLKNGELFEVK